MYIIWGENKKGDENQGFERYRKGRIRQEIGDGVNKYKEWLLEV
jgi:hypothetical protein